MRKLLEELDVAFEASKQVHEDGSNCERVHLAYPVLRSYIHTLEKVIEKAEYEGAMARGDVQSMSIGQGLKRLDNCLNVLKFKDPYFVK